MGYYTEFVRLLRTTDYTDLAATVATNLITVIDSKTADLEQATNRARERQQQLQQELDQLRQTNTPDSD